MPKYTIQSLQRIAFGSAMQRASQKKALVASVRGVEALDAAVEQVVTAARAVEARQLREHQWLVAPILAQGL